MTDLAQLIISLRPAANRAARFEESISVRGSDLKALLDAVEARAVQSVEVADDRAELGKRVKDVREAVED